MADPSPCGASEGSAASEARRKCLEGAPDVSDPASPATPQGSKRWAIVKTPATKRRAGRVPLGKGCEPCKSRRLMDGHAASEWAAEPDPGLRKARRRPLTARNTTPETGEPRLAVPQWRGGFGFADMPMDTASSACACAVRFRALAQRLSCLVCCERSLFRWLRDSGEPSESAVGTPKSSQCENRESLRNICRG